MSTQTLTVELGTRSYPIFIGKDLLADFSYFSPYITGSQVLIISNETIAPLYLEKLQDNLKNFQPDIYILPDGEEYKNLASLEKIFDCLLNKHHHRNTTLIALGGGVVGDITGFAAACYQRGVNFIQVPTTLLAQVDSSVGGKTAVNHPLGKNMIGAFYQPKAVIADYTTLSTLPKRELHAGMAEVIKYGLIYDYDFFCYLENHILDLISHEQQTLSHVIKTCCQIKAAIVTRDEKEAGLRAILNFGHTFGHAIERILGYGEFLHGEAVAVGMLLATKLSVELGYLQSADVARLKTLLEALDLPTELPLQIDVAQMMTAMGMDKKASSQGIRYIILEKLGKAAIHANIPNTVVEAIMGTRRIE